MPGLVAADGEAQMGDEGVRWVSNFGPGRKRIRLHRKNPAHLVGHSCNHRHVFGRGCIVLGLQDFQVLIVRGGVAISMVMGSVLFILGLG